MSEDTRCCGTGTCIINEHGECWCGQRWDGQKMCAPTLPAALAAIEAGRAVTPADAGVTHWSAPQPDTPESR